MTGKLIIFSAPSGAGKTTVVKELLKTFSNFEFSVSATSRAPRGVEQNGVEYHFMSNDEFKQRAENNEFVEWEEVYAGTCYGTLRSELERIWAKGNVILFDVDVLGGIRLKEIFGDAACSIFIMPPSIETLRSRLIGRATDAPEVIEKRVGKAEFEISKSAEFDHVIVNDELDVAVAQTEVVIRKFLEV
ncbi:MAG: guanylate kinase [Rikenellaceae bacterium]